MIQTVKETGARHAAGRRDLHIREKKHIFLAINVEVTMKKKEMKDRPFAFSGKRDAVLKKTWPRLAMLALFVCLLAPGCGRRPALNPQVRPPIILGIFGGMGPEATANMYQLIVKLTPAARDQEHIPTLIYSFPQVPDRTAAIQSGDPAIVPYLIEGVTRLQDAGASFIIIPCNTAHYYYGQMQAAVKIPIVHMIRETVRHVAENYPEYRRIGLLATSGTIRSGLYEKEFAAGGRQTIIPDGSVEADYVMKAIARIKAGDTGKESEDLLAAAGAHLEAKGAQVLVLGCTEIPLAFNPARAKVPVVNATRVLAEAAIRTFREMSRRKAGSSPAGSK
jgi:aspartate racemase